MTTTETETPTLVECDQCGSDEASTETRTVNSDEMDLCESCYDSLQTCAECNNESWEVEEYQSRYGSGIDGMDLCESCRSGIWTCENCDSENLGSTGECVNENDTYECGECGSEVNSHGDDNHDCEPSGNLGLHPYSYKPIPKFLGDGPLYVGVEVETHVLDYDAAAELVEALTGKRTRLYAKEDSTVQGFELVSHPFNPRQFLNGDFDDRLPFKLLDDAARDNAILRHSSDAGLHLHMSRAAFSQSHLLRFLMVHHHMRKLCGLIGGRGTDSNWGNFNPDEKTQERARKAKWAGSGARYSAVNCTNDETIELRYPRGDSSLEGVRLIVEWALALYLYTKTYTAKDANAGAFRNPRRLVDWLRANKAEYPTVWARVEEYLITGDFEPRVSDVLNPDDYKEPMPAPARSAAASAALFQEREVDATTAEANGCDCDLCLDGRRMRERNQLIAQRSES